MKVKLNSRRLYIDIAEKRQIVPLGGININNSINSVINNNIYNNVTEMEFNKCITIVKLGEGFQRITHPALLAYPQEKAPHPDPYKSLK